MIIILTEVDLEEETIGKYKKYVHKFDSEVSVIWD